jgi:hypothetical protein
MVLFIGGAAFAYWVYTGSSNTYDTLATAATLSPPTGISATEASATSVNVSWTNPANPTGTEYLLTQNGSTVCETASNSCPTITGLGAGTTYSYSVDAILGAHWTSLASATSFTTMAVHVTSPTSGSTYGTNWTSSEGGTVSGTYSAASGTTTTAVKVSIDQGTGPNTCWNGTSNSWASACSSSYVTASFSSGTWSLSLPVGDLNSVNTYYITAEATDSASVTGTSSTVSFTYNAGAPSPGAPVPSATNHSGTNPYWVNAETVGLTDTVTYSGAGTVSSVSYYYCYNNSSCTSSNGTLIGTATSGSLNVPSWSVNWAITSISPSTADGDYYVVAVATDSLSNVGTSTATQVGIDRTPPSVSNPSVNTYS